MGIAGHVLNPKKVRALSARSGLQLDRAYRRNRECEGVVWSETGCTHYEINFETGEYRELEKSHHWTSCPGTHAHRALAKAGWYLR